MASPPVFGSNVTVTPPAISPLLRRSGNRPGSAEPPFASDENFSFLSETLENRSESSLKHGPAIMPSPIFLWRFKVLLFSLWSFICCKVSFDSVMRMSADLRDLFLYEVFLYYNPLLLVTMMVWLWGVNLWVFSQSSVNYAKIFDLDHTHLTHKEMWKVLLYAVVLMIFIFPFDIFYLSSRYYFLKTLWRILLPLQAITFADFFIADILTSMSKVATIAWFEADSICGSHSVAIPLVLVLPYLCRFFQCVRQYKDTKEKTCLLNALKYSTAVPVIFLSALKYHVLPESWTNFYHPLWLLSSVVNSLYSFYWDVTRDWDLSVLTRIFKFKSPNICSNLLYGRQWVYYWVIGSNLILRCTWTYKLSAHLRHNYLTVFAITALEILRRFQWVFFRVENEWNKMMSKQNLQVSMSELPSEEEKLLGLTNHNV
ncbi:unnamed protein product [Victoria cruziana]